MVGIKDVAKQAGVSVSTVSNVLNGRVNQMRKETLERIEQCIKDLHYLPNRSAQQLKSGQVKMFGVLIPSFMNPNFASLVNILERIAREKYGYQIILGNTNRQDEQEQRFLEDISSFGIKGAIVVSANTDKPHFIKAIEKGMHLVSFDGLLSSEKNPCLIDSISMDNFKAGELAASFLLEQGLSQLMFVSIHGDIISRFNKISGFKSELKKHGIDPVGKELIIEKTEDFGDAELMRIGSKAADILLHSRKKLPEGIVAINDMVALGMISRFQSLGIKVPDDISIIGIDDIYLSSYMSPALTTISSPLPKMAQQMLKRLIDRIEGHNLKPKEFLYMPKLVCRDSVKILK
ncbi:LacI family DNA-binding transcriptional regulator [Succinatimonas hippei]|uniref:LacI family DNA-binding transcriptional regulator n=1 Tax=Succinatimonas hippei TaxID=626938 RepID=UPI0024928B73|nr:LacI family DNA-binding transcriptional regulator [Succinatimonas hippei]